MERKQLISFLSDTVQGDSFQLENVPGMLKDACIFVFQLRGLNEKEKKLLIVEALQEACPNDVLDKLMPGLVDIAFELIKYKVRNARCCCIS